MACLSFSCRHERHRPMLSQLQPSSWPSRVFRLYFAFPSFLFRWNFACFCVIIFLAVWEFTCKYGISDKLCALNALNSHLLYIPKVHSLCLGFSTCQPAQCPLGAKEFTNGPLHHPPSIHMESHYLLMHIRL